jgi:serine/threonine protein phosphatase 1
VTAYLNDIATVLEDTIFFTGGEIFKYYNKKKDCTFYNIDCGCAYTGYKEGCRLAAIRLEDKKYFYV